MIFKCTFIDSFIIMANFSKKNEILNLELWKDAWVGSTVKFQGETGI